MKIKLINVNDEHWNFILSLRNAFFEHSFYEQKHAISKDEHYEYMKKQTANPNFHQWIAASDGLPIGYIRILDHDINIMVDKKFQNKGVGTIMLKLVEEKAKKLGLKKLEARVLTENQNSLKLFQKNDFQIKMNQLEKKL